jgi:hypothetical protein
MKDVQATEEKAFSPQKRTSNTATSKHEISSLFKFLLVIFSPPTCEATSSGFMRIWIPTLLEREWLIKDIELFCRFVSRIRIRSGFTIPKSLDPDQPVLRIRDPESGAFLTPGSGIRDPEQVFSGSWIPNPYF